MPLTDTLLRDAAQPLVNGMNATSGNQMKLVLFSGPAPTAATTYADLNDVVLGGLRSGYIERARSGNKVVVYARGSATSTSDLTVNYAGLIYDPFSGSNTLIAACPITSFTFVSGISPGRMWIGRLKFEYFDKDNP